jgi:multiple sugar transport system substrate-binding protein
MSNPHLRSPGRSRKTALALGAVVTASALLLAACGGGSDSGASADGKVTLNFAWWGDATRAKVTQAAVDLFQQQHTNITVKTTYTPFGSYEAKISTQVAGGNAPDLFQVDRGFQSEFSQRGVLADLTKNADTLNLSGLDAKFADSGKDGAKQVAVPFGQTTQSIVVNTAKLKELGVPEPTATWTWDDLKTWAQQIHDKSGGKLSGLADPGSTWGAFESWQLQNGKLVYTPDGKIAFTQQDLEAFWNFTTGLSKSGAATPATVTATIDGTPANEPLAKGLAASEWDYDSVFGSHVAATKDQLGLYSLPTVAGKTGMYARPSMLLSVAAKSQHPKEAAELLSFLVNDSGAAKALGTGRGLFPNLTVRTAQATGAEGAVKQVYDYEATAEKSFVPTPPAPPKGDGQLLTLMQRTYQAVAFGQQSVSAGAASFMSQAQSAIG